MNIKPIACYAVISIENGSLQPAKIYYDQFKARACFILSVINKFPVFKKIINKKIKSYLLINPNVEMDWTMFMENYNEFQRTMRDNVILQETLIEDAPGIYFALPDNSALLIDGSLKHTIKSLEKLCTDNSILLDYMEKTKINARIFELKNVLERVQDHHF